MRQVRKYCQEKNVIGGLRLKGDDVQFFFLPSRTLSKFPKQPTSGDEDRPLHRCSSGYFSFANLKGK